MGALFGGGGGGGQKQPITTSPSPPKLSDTQVKARQKTAKIRKRKDISDQILTNDQGVRPVLG